VIPPAGDFTAVTTGSNFHCAYPVDLLKTRLKDLLEPALASEAGRRSLRAEIPGRPEASFSWGPGRPLAAHWPSAGLLAIGPCRQTGAKTAPSRLAWPLLVLLLGRTQSMSHRHAPQIVACLLSVQVFAGCGAPPEDTELATTSEALRPRTDPELPVDDPPVEERPTRPSAPHACDYADLVMHGSMWFHEGDPTRIGINVTNLGTVKAVAPPFPCGIGVTLNGTFYLGQLFVSEANGHPVEPNTLYPEQSGFIWINMMTPVVECTEYSVAIDIERYTQKAAACADPFANDRRQLSIQCPMRWSVPISKQRLGLAPDPVDALGDNPMVSDGKETPPPPDVVYYGYSLQQIVSSQVKGTALGYCADCHNSAQAQSASPLSSYNPDVPAGDRGSVIITHGTKVGGAYWWNTWAPAFLDAWPYGLPKYAPLRDAIKKWQADGSLP
jgi:hypothetical protein